MNKRELSNLVIGTTFFVLVFLIYNSFMNSTQAAGTLNSLYQLDILNDHHSAPVATPIPTASPTSIIIRYTPTPTRTPTPTPYIIIGKPSPTPTRTPTLTSSPTPVLDTSNHQIFLPMIIKQ